MEGVRSPLATFDASGALIASTRSFRREADARILRTIGDAVRALDLEEGDRRWVIVQNRRVLIEALIGTGRAYAVRVYAAESHTKELTDVLSPRQFEIAEYAAVGATAKEIAKLLGISAHTVRQHLKEVYRRLGVANRIELSRWFDAEKHAFPTTVLAPPATYM